MDRLRRALVSLTVALFALLLLTVEPAAAGGSTWNTDAGHYAPGDTALLWAAVSWGHNPDLGDPADGPYGVWLHGPGRQGWSAGSVPSGAIYVGDIAIDAIDVNVGPHVASVEFTVPDLSDGTYAIVHCDWPCTTQLGDITFGELTVDRDGVIPSPPTTTVVPPTTTAAPGTTVPPTPMTSPPTTMVELEPVGIAANDDDSTGGSGPTVALVLMTVGLIAVVAAGPALRSRRPTTPNEVVA